MPCEQRCTCLGGVISLRQWSKLIFSLPPKHCSSIAGVCPRHGLLWTDEGAVGHGLLRGPEVGGGTAEEARVERGDLIQELSFGTKIMSKKSDVESFGLLWKIDPTLFLVSLFYLKSITLVFEHHLHIVLQFLMRYGHFFHAKFPINFSLFFLGKKHLFFFSISIYLKGNIPWNKWLSVMRKRAASLALVPTSMGFLEHFSWWLKMILERDAVLDASCILAILFGNMFLSKSNLCKAFFPFKVKTLLCFLVIVPTHNCGLNYGIQTTVVLFFSWNNHCRADWSSSGRNSPSGTGPKLYLIFGRCSSNSGASSPRRHLTTASAGPLGQPKCSANRPVLEFQS